MLSWEQTVAQSWRTLLRSTQGLKAAFPRKLRQMQDAYLQRSSQLHTEAEAREIRYYLNAVLYKFTLADLSLEQLWAMSMDTRAGLVDALENSLDRLDITDEDLLLISFALECALLQSRAFLDFHMVYVCLVLKADHRGAMSGDKFARALGRVQHEPLRRKAQQVREYYETRVFGKSQGGIFAPSDWGTVLCSLRDRIAHRDRLRPSFQSQERLLDKVLLNWPTLRGATYERFAQMIQNGMYFLAKDVATILYEQPWPAR